VRSGVGGGELSVPQSSRGCMKSRSRDQAACTRAGTRRRSCSGSGRRTTGCACSATSCSWTSSSSVRAPASRSAPACSRLCSVRRLQHQPREAHDADVCRPRIRRPRLLEAVQHPQGQALGRDEPMSRRRYPCPCWRTVRILFLSVLAIIVLWYLKRRGHHSHPRLGATAGVGGAAAAGTGAACVARRTAISCSSARTRVSASSRYFSCEMDPRVRCRPYSRMSAHTRARAGVDKRDTPPSPAARRAAWTAAAPRRTRRVPSGPPWWHNCVRCQQAAAVGAQHGA
jgi:hypothetical protein